MIAKFFSIVFLWFIFRLDGDMEDIVVWIVLKEDLGDLGDLSFDFDFEENDFIGDDGGDVATNRDDV